MAAMSLRQSWPTLYIYLPQDNRLRSQVLWIEFNMFARIAISILGPLARNFGGRRLPTNGDRKHYNSISVPRQFAALRWLQID